MIEVTLPLRLVNELNDHSYWRGRQKRAKEQRTAVGLVVNLSLIAASMRAHIYAGPWCITLTRIAPRRLDSDGVVASCKHVRDGVADALGIDDGDARLDWRYEQRRAVMLSGYTLLDRETGTAKGYGVHIRIEAKERTTNE